MRSIAVVHEILSRDTADEVDFNDILPSLVRMAEDLGRDDRPVRITYRGEAGQLQASVATPLAVVITELLQNAAEHAWPDRARPAAEAGWRAAGRRGTGEAPLQVDVELHRTDTELRVTVRDNGVGLPPASPSTTPPASGCPSSAAWSGPRWAARSSCATTAGPSSRSSSRSITRLTTSRTSETWAPPAGAPGARRGNDQARSGAVVQTDLEGRGRPL